MNDIEIKNESVVISACQSILNYNKQNVAYIESLESALQSINADWESNGRDKESYVAELEKQIQNLKVVQEQTNNFANIILEYVENVKTIGSATM